MKAFALASVAGLTLVSSAMAQVSIINSVPGTFSDISTTGTRLGGGDDAQFSVAGTTNSLFTNSLYRACTNGFVQFGGTAGATTFTNASIGAAGSPFTTGSALQAVCPFWDDLITVASVTTAGVFAQTFAVAPAGLNVNGSAYTGAVTIIQWQNMDLFNIANTLNATFQLQVYGTPVVAGGNTVFAQFVYSNINFGAVDGTTDHHNDGASATVGYIGDTSGTNNFQWSFNTSLGAPPPVLSVVTAVPTPGAAALLGLGGLALGRRRR